MPIFKKSKLNDDNKDFIESSSPEKEIIIDVIKIKIDRKANLKKSIKNTESEKNINIKIHLFKNQIVMLNHKKQINIYNTLKKKNLKNL